MPCPGRLSTSNGDAPGCSDRALMWTIDGAAPGPAAGAGGREQAGSDAAAQQGGDQALYELHARHNPSGSLGCVSPN
jgi:hypothetical protein